MAKYSTYGTATPASGDKFLYYDVSDNQEKLADFDDLGGGGGITWTQVANEDGSSFANWTAASGTWSSNGTVIQQTDTGTDRRARLTAGATYSRDCALVGAADVRIPSDNGGSQYAGIQTTDSNGVSANGWTWRIQHASGTWKVMFGQTNVLENYLANMGSGGIPAGAFNTWYRLRMLVLGGMASVWIDGVYFASFNNPATIAPDSIGLYAYTTAADFRNYGMWTADLGIPA